MDDEDPDDNGTEVEREMFPTNRPRTFVCSVRRDRIVVSLDGKPLINWKGNASRLSVDEDRSVPDKRVLFLCSDDTLYRFHELRLVPVSGSGRRIR